MKMESVNHSCSLLHDGGEAWWTETAVREETRLERMFVELPALVGFSGHSYFTPSPFLLEGAPFLCRVCSRRWAISPRRCRSELTEVISPTWSLLFMITRVTGNALCPLQSQTCAFLMLTADWNIRPNMVSLIFTLTDVNRHRLKKMDVFLTSNYRTDLLKVQL